MEAYQRLGRRLREHHERLGGAPVGTRHEGVTLELFTGWDDEYGQLTVLRISCAFQADLYRTRQLAQAVIGRRWISAREWVHDCRTVLYVLELDRCYHEPTRPPQFREPFGVRWYDARQLAQGIGQQDSGTWARRGRRLIPVQE